MGEDAGKGFPFLLQLFIPDYPTVLPWCGSPYEGLIHCLNNSELMWSESLGLEVLLLIFLAFFLRTSEHFTKNCTPALENQQKFLDTGICCLPKKPQTSELHD